MLQRFAEVFQYASLLNRAAQDTNPHIRLALVAAFCVAGFNNNIIFNNENFYENELELLDRGLNSPYIVNIEEIKSILRKNKIY